MKKKVLILTEYQLQEGGNASYERIKCYAKAVPEVDFIIYHPYADYKKPIRAEIYLDNLYYCQTSLCANKYFYRNFAINFDFYHPFKICRHIFHNYFPEFTKILLYSSNMPFFAMTIGLLKYCKKFEVIVEKNELERGIIQNIIVQKSLSKIALYFVYPIRWFSSLMIDEFLTKHATSVISISQSLFEKYNKSVDTVLVPILVDCSRFHKKSEFCNNPLRFVFLGSFYENKDSIMKIIEAADLIHFKGVEFQLNLIGGGNKSTFDSINDYINIRGLNDVVKIYGTIPGYEVPFVLIQFDYGLLLREVNLQTHFGFSTKLGEYLASGLPVIYTDVSDNIKYLKDSEHGFLVPFPIEENLPDVLIKAIAATANLRDSMKNKARELALKEFDYNLHKRRLNNIFN